MHKVSIRLTRVSSYSLAFTNFIRIRWDSLVHLDSHEDPAGLTRGHYVSFGSIRIHWNSLGITETRIRAYEDSLVHHRIDENRFELGRTSVVRILTFFSYVEPP